MRKFIITIFLFISTNCFACEFLILNRTDLPSKSKWARFDIVNVQDDGFAWGNAEVLPKFVLVKVTGMTKSEGLDYLIPLLDGSKNIIACRTYKLKTSVIPVEVLNTLTTTGSITITRAVALTYLESK